MNADDYKWIDSYLEGSLDEGEMAAFQKRLAEDPAFLEAYEVRKSMDIFLKGQTGRKSLKKDLEALSEQYFDKKQDSAPKDKIVAMRPRWWRYAAAAAAVLMLVFAINYFLPEKSLYHQYADVGTMSLVQKGPETEIGKAETAFNSKNYSAATDHLEIYLAQTPEDTQARYYLGLAALESNQFQKALEVFNEIDSGVSAYQPVAKWWIAMTYLKMEDLPQCRTILRQMPEGNTFYERAQELLNDLK